MWQGWDGSHWQIYSNFAGQLTNDNTNNVTPAISGTNVVWGDFTWLGLETNFAGAVPGVNNLCALWRTLGNTSPDISGTTIVWDGGDISGEGDIEILMATYTPDVVPVPGAVLLGAIGEGLVAWLRGRRSL